MRIFFYFISFIYFSLFINCTNSNFRYFSNLQNTINNNETEESEKVSFQITNVTLSDGSNRSSNNSNINIFFNSNQSIKLSNYCSVGNSNNISENPCLCQFTWTEINPNAGAGLVTQRSVSTILTTLQPYVAICPAPAVYNSEIINGTVISISVIAAPNNPNLGLFTVPVYKYTKNNLIVTGSFQDSQGKIFDNILHYSCYQKFLRGMSIRNRVVTETNKTTAETAKAIVGTQFCIASANGNASSSEDCPNMPPPDYSAQAYYYNLYIRNTERGDINQFNESFTCPLVKEGLYSNSSSIATQNQYWPMDTQFALALSPSKTFSVGVVANTKLSIGSTASMQNTTCFNNSEEIATTPTSSDANSFITSCLGFAAPVNTDGTCPFFMDSSNLIRPTYRLRRYIALYPRVFDTNGRSITGKPQDIDTIYVLDRPVKGPSNSNPQKPYTMLGPKPCPFSFFDRKGVVNNTVGYRATSNLGWSGKNIDGIEFPNRDSLPGENTLSCSATFPILTQNKTTWSLATVNINNAIPGWQHMYVRPIESFYPHYEEDTEFLACAPQAFPLKDPPLHFTRDPDSGRVAWCAESYPTQNPNIQSLDPAVFPSASPSIPTGLISPYTSHTVKNTASQPCEATFLNNLSTNNYNYSLIPPDPTNPLYALHNTTNYDDTYSSAVTCDRTVQSIGLSWTRFPLLAHAADIESSIYLDSSYMCLITYDQSSAKTFKTTPQTGCCDLNVVSVPTGFSGASKAHLEPDVACGIPEY